MKGLRVSRIGLIALVLASAGLLLLAPAAGQADAKPQAVPGETIPLDGTIPPIATPLYLPAISAGPSTPAPPPPPARAYESVPVAGESLGWPAEQSPDVNLALRGYTPTVAYLGLVNYSGDTDPNAPQLDDLFTPARLPVFKAAYQVFDWNWSCDPPNGCLGAPITDYSVTLIEMVTTPGEPVAIPSRGPQIYTGDFKAMVLYATESRITLAYTRADTPANGYVVHLEELGVAPELAALYRQLDNEGRKRLPALRNGEVLGVARATLKAVVRDTGQFMDPRSCKDWWMDYMGQCTVRLERPRGSGR